jgi:hypothetical protein
MRHRWLRLREHTRICLKCGCGKVARELGGNQWETTYHTPDGRSRSLDQTPDCVEGPHTARYLKKYELEIRELS